MRGDIVEDDKHRRILELAEKIGNDIAEKLWRAFVRPFNTPKPKETPK